MATTKPSDRAQRGTAVLDAADPRRDMAILSPLNLLQPIRQLWKKGMPPGDSTGWKSMDKHWTVDAGQLTIITGWPGSGKSEWLDAVLIALARIGWRGVIFSPENQPVQVHVVKLIEKLTGMPFGDGPTQRMTEDQVEVAAEKMDSWFRFIAPDDQSDRTTFGVDEIMDAAQRQFAVEGWGEDVKKFIVIDPWNELEHLRPSHMSETEYVSEVLTKLRRWGRVRRVHIFIVAHPQKMRRDDSGKLPIPRPDMISGSQHWWNKADNSICVWREFGSNTNEAEIHIQKVRFKHIGIPGVVTLRYDRVTGRYAESTPAPVHHNESAESFSEGL